MKNNIGIIALSFVATIVVVLIYHFNFSHGRIVIEERIPIQLASNHSSLSNNFTSTEFVLAAKKAMPAVVFIRSLKRIDEFYRNEYTSTSGSGVIVSSQGYIITNQHVIKNADRLEVVLNDNRTFKAKVVGVDEATDLAILKIDKTNLPFIPFGNSTSIEIGEFVLAIGNPLGLQSSVTAGIVSAKARNINILIDSNVESFIQTDAAVNPGNSGGALVDTKGELIGINTAIVTSSGRYEGYSFAVPSIIVQKVFKDILEFGTVQRAWLGVNVSEISDDLLNQLVKKELSGVKVELVNKNGAAKSGGIKRNDVIISIENVSISTKPEFNEELSLYRPGDKISISYYRNNKVYSTEVVLRNQRNGIDIVSIRKDKILIEMGFELRNLDGIEKKRMQTSGVLVVSVYKNSAVSKSNLEPNYIITKCNGIRVKYVSEIMEILNNSSSIIKLEGFYEDIPGQFPYSIMHNTALIN